MRLSAILLFAVFSLFFLTSYGGEGDENIIRQTVNPEYLFEIEVNELYGYIDSTGKEVIPPQFHATKGFSEGLAAVRKDGLYGYIDGTGQFVIPERFDMAGSFNEGVAIAYVDGKAMYINKKGEEPFENPYATIAPFENGRANVTTYTNKSGVINREGKLLIDTAFAGIFDFINGVAPVVGLTHIEPGWPDYGLIDTNGKLVLPYGTYERIRNHDNNYFAAFKVYTKYGDQTDYIIVGANGKITITSNKDSADILGRTQSEDLILTRFEHPEFVRKLLDRRDTNIKNYYYIGYTDKNNIPVISDTNCIEGTIFADGRAFVKTANGKWKLINTAGETVTDEVFDDVSKEHPFQDGYAVVGKDSLWGIIDTNGVYTVPRQFAKTRYDDIIDGSYMFFYNNRDVNLKSLYGIIKTDGTIIIGDTLQSFDGDGFIYGLLRCQIACKLTYINERGKIVWQQPSVVDTQLLDYNVDCIGSGLYKVGSIAYKDDLGEYLHYENMPRKILKKERFKKRKLSVKVNPKRVVSWRNKYKGYKVYISNKSKKNSYFWTDYCDLQMNIQALDKSGKWVDIESSGFDGGCGNSMRTRTLAPGQVWELTTPKYNGPWKTKLRICLKYTDRPGKILPVNNLTVYSNEYKGWINPALLWSKDRHYFNYNTCND